MKTVINDARLCFQNKEVGSYDADGRRNPVVRPVVTLRKEFLVGEDNNAMAFAVKLEKFLKENP